MTFKEVLAQVIEWLQENRRISYRALKRQFNLDDDYLEDLKEELLFSHPVLDEDGRGLVWTGDTEQDISAPPDTVPASTQSTEQKPPPITYTPPHLTEKILTSRRTLEGERKQVTVLFADIKDSTELIKDLDPEDAQQLLDPVIHLMMDAVHRFEGTVNQVLGDGIMSIFGAPIAHEDHALRACYAALAMQNIMQSYTDDIRQSHGLTLRIRVGLNAGEVVVRTIGNDLHMDYSAVGAATHLAARMEQLADPGSIILTASTLGLVEGRVRVKDLGAVPVKGITDPVEVFELLGASGIKRRLQAAIARGLTRFVGRETEIDTLVQALERAKRGQGQVVAAVGEAGVGKSRLVYECVHSPRTRGWNVLESASLSYGKATPYFPVIDLLKRYAHIEDGDETRLIRAKLTGQILTLDETLQAVIPSLLSLLGALPEESPFLQLDPVQRRYQTLEALKRVLLRESRVQPLVVVFEDLHWIDSETQALLDNLVDALPTAQLLLLVNYRPEYTHGWGSKTYYTQLRLDPLPPASAEAFLQALLGDDASMEPLKQLLIARTEGNPFFLEESVRTLVETDILEGESGSYCLVQKLLSIQVPATVQAILAARIDRLSLEEKQLLQTAAVIGTEVPFTLLKAIVDLSEAALHRGLAHLQTAEFLYETNLYPEREYTFKHALTHDVAYGSLLQERRRNLHAQIVKVMESLIGERMDEQVEQLAHHALRGEVWEKALRYYRQAGTKAMGQSAYREAVTCFEQALEALHHLPESRDRMAQAIDLFFALRHAFQEHGELGRVRDSLRNAERLAEALDDSYRLGWVSCHLTNYFYRTSDPERALTAGQRALTLATASGDVTLQVATHFNLGLVYFNWGDYERAIDLNRQTVASIEDDRLYEDFGMSILPAAVSRGILAGSLAEQGKFAEGRVYGDEGMRIAEAADSPETFLRIYSVVGNLYLLKGDLPQAISVLERGLKLCQGAYSPISFPNIASALGYAYALCGRVDEALPLIERAVEQAAAMSVWAFQARRVAGLSEAYLLAGCPEKASALARHALDLSHTHKQRGYQAWVLRLLGAIAMHHDPPDIDQAATHYRQALVLAEELGMRPLQAHCHRGLGVLYHQTGHAEQAHAELSTAIEMYRDMEMTFWLPETEAGLAAVEGQT